MGQPAMLNGIVKGVLSGDTLIIMGVPPPGLGRYPTTTHHAHAAPHFTGADASKGPPPEKQISLSGVASPRLGNRNGTPDQPFAWAAREFLRKSVIGKRVTSFMMPIGGSSPNVSPSCGRACAVRAGTSASPTE